jgi:hypothetical protein
LIYQEKKGAMMQKANVSHGKSNMDKTVRRRELPWVHHSRSLYRKRIVRGAGLKSIQRKKVMKKQRRTKKRNWREKLTLISVLKLR